MEVKSYVPYGILDFDELDRYRTAQELAKDTYDLTDDFNGILWGIMNNTDVQDKPTTIIALANDYATRVKELESAYKADPSAYHESGDKDCVDCAKEKDEPVAETPVEEKDGQESTLARYVTAVKEAVRGVIEPLFKKKEEIIDDENGFIVFKDNEGNMRWLATYSNNILDDDRPREIISAKSHQRFVQLVDEQKAPMPELWVWHSKEFRFGEADWVAYDDDGFALAAGTVDKGCEDFAEYLSKCKGVRMSHGMPIGTIRRDPQDARVIVEHITKEISVLPAFAAANQFTSFVVLKSKEDTDMSVPEKKLEALKGAWGEGVTPFLDALSQKNASAKSKAAEEGRETKEKDTEVAAEVTSTETPATETVIEPAVETPVEEADEPKYATVAEIAEAFTNTVKPFVERVEQNEAALAAFSEKFDSLSKDISGLLQTDEQKIKEIVSVLPAASLSALLAHKFSAIGSKETQIDGRSALAKDKPAEAAQITKSTGVPFLDAMIYGEPPQQ
jgi:hypothetical protein